MPDLITLKQNTKQTVQFSIVDDNDDMVNISGWNFRFTVKEAFGVDDAVIFIDASGVIVSAPSGIVEAQDIYSEYAFHSAPGELVIWKGAASGLPDDRTAYEVSIDNAVYES